MLGDCCRSSYDSVGLADGRKERVESSRWWGTITLPADWFQKARKRALEDVLTPGGDKRRKPRGSVHARVGDFVG